MKLRKDFIDKSYEDADDVKGFDFSNADLQNVSFLRANLEGANFRGSNLKGANLEGAIMIDVNLDGANLEGANLEDVDMRHSTFNRVNFNGVNFKGSDFTAAVFEKGQLRGANFENAVFRYCGLMNADLQDANMTRTQLEGVDLTGAYMEGVNLSNSNLEEADLTDANLTRVNLRNANLQNSILTNADLSTADLTNCNLDGSNYESAILHHRTTYKIFNWLFSSVQTMVPIQITNNFDKNNVFDFIYGSIPLIDVDDDNVIFYIQNQFQGLSFPRDALQRAYDDRSSIFVSCNQIVPRGAVSIETVIPYHLFFRINLTMSLFVPIDSIKALLASNHKEWYIKDTGNMINYSASVQVVYDNSNLNIFGEEVQLISKDHCQSGTRQKSYSMYPIEFILERVGGKAQKKKKGTYKKRCKSSKKKTCFSRKK
jgi:uncharacterized protein YjbI with pentapeptide repeats